MTINSLNDFSTTPANNTNIAGTSIAVGCAPADVGVYMRTLMSFLAYCVQGASNLFAASWFCGTLTTSTTNGATGNATIGGALTVTDAANTGSTFDGDVTINGTGNALNVPNGNIVANYIEANGSVATTASGYQYGPAGQEPFNGTVGFAILCSGTNILASGFYSSSDRRKKKKIRKLAGTDAEAFVLSMKIYTYIKDGRPEAGVIAQDVIKAGYPEYVTSSACVGLKETTDKDGFVSKAGVQLNVHHDSLLAQTMAALQSALARIEALERKLA